MLALVTGWFAASKLKLIEYGLVALLIAAIFFAIWNSSHQRSELSEEVGRQKQTILELNQRIGTLNAVRDAERRDVENVMQNHQKITDDLASIREDIARRQTVITKHDLGKIGAAKPNLLEDRINKATAAQLHRFEQVTRP